MAELKVCGDDYCFYYKETKLSLLLPLQHLFAHLAVTQPNSNNTEFEDILQTTEKTKLFVSVGSEATKIPQQLVRNVTSFNWARNYLKIEQLADGIHQQPPT